MNDFTLKSVKDEILDICAIGTKYNTTAYFDRIVKLIDNSKDASDIGLMIRVLAIAGPNAKKVKEVYDEINLLIQKAGC